MFNASHPDIHYTTVLYTKGVPEAKYLIRKGTDNGFKNV